MGTICGVERFDPMDAQPGSRSTAAVDHGDLDVVKRSSCKPPKSRSRAVTDERAIPAGQDRSELMGTWERYWVSDQVDASISVMQGPVLEPPPHSAAAHAGDVQLKGRNQRELLVRDPQDRRFTAAGRVHKAPKLGSRYDFGEISA